MSVKTRTSLRYSDLPRTFAALCDLFPPRPIRDEVEHDNMMEVIDVLAVRGGKLTKDQADYLELLSTLVSAYDDAHLATDVSHMTALDRLKSLCEDNGVTAAALGALLGSRSLGAKLLRGEREPSTAHIRMLAEHFRLSPEYFFD